MKYALLPGTLLIAMAAHAQSITEYRWWINDDVSTITTAAIAPSAELTLATNLDLPALTKDYNTVTVQFKDSDGRYGVPYTMLYSRGTGAVSGYEWWIDDDIAGRTSGAIGPDDVVDLVADLPTGTMSGDHLFTIRFRSVNGTWSVPLTTVFSFFTEVEELPGINDLLLFPNPVTDRLTLRLSSVESRPLRLSMLDVTGRVVREERNWAPIGTATRSWDLAELKPGTYGLRIEDGHRSTTLRFVKR